MKKKNCSNAFLRHALLLIVQEVCLAASVTLLQLVVVAGLPILSVLSSLFLIIGRALAMHLADEKNGQVRSPRLEGEE